MTPLRYIVLLLAFCIAALAMNEFMSLGIFGWCAPITPLTSIGSYKCVLPELRDWGILAATGLVTVFAVSRSP